MNKKRRKTTSEESDPIREHYRRIGKKGSEKVWTERPAGSPERKEVMKKIWEGRDRYYAKKRAQEAQQNA